MTSRVKTPTTLHEPRAGRRQGIVLPQPMFARCPPIRQLIAINDLCVDLDITYDKAVRRAFGYENERLGVGEVDAVPDGPLKTEESNAWECCNDNEIGGGGSPENHWRAVGLRSLPGGHYQGQAAERERCHTPDRRAVHRLSVREGRMLEMREGQGRHSGPGMRRLSSFSAQPVSQEFVARFLIVTCPGHTGTEVAGGTYGPDVPFRRVNKLCRRLVHEGLVERQ